MFAEKQSVLSTLSIIYGIVILSSVLTQQKEGSICLCFSANWSKLQDSNLRLLAPKASALPPELNLAVCCRIVAPIDSISSIYTLVRVIENHKGINVPYHAKVV